MWSSIRCKWIVFAIFAHLVFLCLLCVFFPLILYWESQRKFFSRLFGRLFLSSISHPITSSSSSSSFCSLSRSPFNDCRFALTIACADYIQTNAELEQLICSFVCSLARLLQDSEDIISLFHNWISFCTFAYHLRLCMYVFMVELKLKQKPVWSPLNDTCMRLLLFSVFWVHILNWIEMKNGFLNWMIPGVNEARPRWTRVDVFEIHCIQVSDQLVAILISTEMKGSFGFSFAEFQPYKASFGIVPSAEITKEICGQRP